MGTTTIAPPEEHTSRAAPPPEPKSPWIYRPWIDLTVGCGAWSAPLLLAGFFAASSYGRAWSVAFYFLALLSNYPHFMATVYRAYHTRDEFEKYRVYTVHVAALLALAGVVTHIWFGLLPWIFTLYICWSPWHYTGQNFGLLMMFARRSGVTPTETERGALRLSFIASYILLMLSFHTGPSGDAMILSLGLPSTLTLPSRIALAAFFLCASGWALVSLARRSSFRSIVPVMTLAATQFLWFLLPAMIELASGREIPQTRYSSGILAVLHSTQYLWITSYYQKKEARAAGNTRWTMRGYLTTLIAGGIALFIPGPWIVSRLLHADFAASFLTFTALVNIHHFLLDGAIWKLRDSRIAALLIDGKQGASRERSEKHGKLIAATHWLTGNTSGARALRIAAVAVLFVWAGMDQLHFWWSSEAGSVSGLQRAVMMNPEDSAVQARLAQAEQLAGQQTAALAAMQRAATVNPASLALQESYGRGLVEARRDVDAYAQFQKILARWPRNADALVDSGMLAHRLGRDEEAIDDWQKAIDVDPRQANAQLYLAQALDQQGELQAAARHYRSYLEIVAARRQRNAQNAGALLAAFIKVADADAASNRAEDAARGYEAAANFAEKASEKTMESLALAHLADLQEKQGDIAGAAQSYQRALRLDADVADAKSVASDWFNYGQFLRKEQQPERFALACFLRAESSLKDSAGEEFEAVKQARAQSEGRLGKEARAVRERLDNVAEEALKLSLSSAAVKK
ncbi:MAG TPA: tetratricopeptide repeat protein [Candidatus Methylomirabilis sp.]|nr:tetratricopeptide repeat protein [Candidatus Methylomirabilis sp.]